MIQYAACFVVVMDNLFFSIKYQGNLLGLFYDITVDVLCCMLQAVISAKEIAMAREEIATAKAFVSIFL